MTGRFVAARSTHVVVDGKPVSSAQLYLEQNICPCPNPAKAAAIVVLRKQKSEGVFQTPKPPTQKKKAIFLQQHRHYKAQVYCASS